MYILSDQEKVEVKIKKIGILLDICIKKFWRPLFKVDTFKGVKKTIVFLFFFFFDNDIMEEMFSPW